MASSPADATSESLAILEDSADHEQEASVSGSVDAPSAQKQALDTRHLCTGHTLVNVRLSGLSNRPEARIGCQPQVFFLHPRPPQSLTIVSIMNASEVAVKKLLPKSSLSRVIIRDNLSAQRIFDLEARASEKNKKKMGHLYDHLKKKFMMDQYRKLGRWRREFLPIHQFINGLREKTGQEAKAGLPKITKPAPAQK